MRATLLLMTGAAACLSACKRDQIYSRQSLSGALAVSAVHAGPPAFVGRWAAASADCARKPWELTPTGLDAPDRMHCSFAKLSEASAGYAADVDCKGAGPEEIGRLTLTLSGQGASRGLTVAGGPFALPVALSPCPAAMALAQNGPSRSGEAAR